jgi:copper chaperone NosL
MRPPSWYTPFGSTPTGHPARTTIAVAGLLVLLAACDGKQTAAVTPPRDLPAEAVAHFCNMVVSEHDGPKGQILLRSGDPVWFTSVRDTFAFTMLPEEPKDIAAIYVTDMAKLKDQRHPDLGSWIDGHDAWYVVGSRERGGMGAAEIFPFGSRNAADAFARDHGGTVTSFDAVPRGAVLESEDAPGATAASAVKP